MAAGVQNRPLVIEGQRFMYTLTERVSDFCPDKVLDRGRGVPAPPSEPYGRFSRIRLSS